MKKNIENNNKQNFLDKISIDNISNNHKKYLGTEIPDDYFLNSKKSILDRIKEDKSSTQNSKHKVFYLHSKAKYFLAASLFFLLALAIWLQFAGEETRLENFNVESIALQDDVLIQSILVDDIDLDVFTDEILFDEVIVKAEQTEEKIDNLIINSLILEDSLTDYYIDEKFIETIIL